MTGHGKPSGSVGTGVGSGGSEGSAGVVLGDGVAGEECDGAGATVGEFVGAGGAVGVAEGATEGADVRVLGVARGVAELTVAGDVGDDEALLLGVTSADAVGVPDGSGDG